MKFIDYFRYIPPLSGFGVSLPVDSASMAIELEKQESLLAQIHEEMSVGTVAKHREEQLWEVTVLLGFSSFEFSMNFLSA